MIGRAFRWLGREWRSRRDPIGFARRLGVRVGDGCELLGTGLATWGTEPFLITLGDHVQVTAGVRFITHDGAIWVYRREHPRIGRFGPIRIGNNVYIGTDAVILPGVTVGDDSVIAACAVVNRDVPARTIVAGVPARPICSIDEYWQKHEHELVDCYGMPEAERRRFLLEKFGLGEPPRLP
ncbi:MAG TPA: acyltransferase [Kofleriaceae bacterium]|nr:acyltransferase [Kofleriaceae bacterium]